MQGGNWWTQQYCCLGKTILPTAFNIKSKESTCDFNWKPFHLFSRFEGIFYTICQSSKHALQFGTKYFYLLICSQLITKTRLQLKIVFTQLAPCCYLFWLNGKCHFDISLEHMVRRSGSVCYDLISHKVQPSDVLATTQNISWVWYESDVLVSVPCGRAQAATLAMSIF